MIRLTLASNAIHLEAARRLRDGLDPSRSGVDVLLFEPERFTLTPADRRRWPLRFPARPLSYLLLAPLALIGLVRELRLAHRRGAGMGLRFLLTRVRRLTLLDDGLDQYRALPKAVDPLLFPTGIDCWLFSDAPAWRAPWCGRFRCRELGPLFAVSPPATAANHARGTLIIDSPGLECLQDQVSALPHPWRLIPHPVLAKRSWRCPLEAGDSDQPGTPEDVLPSWRGTIVVGESLMLLAALRLRAPGVRLLLALPRSVDTHFATCVSAAVAREPLTRLIVG